MRIVQKRERKKEGKKKKEKEGRIDVLLTVTKQQSAARSSRSEARRAAPVITLFFTLVTNHAEILRSRSRRVFVNLKGPPWFLVSVKKLV